jgi:hypothetical protein
LSDKTSSNANAPDFPDTGVAWKVIYPSSAVGVNATPTTSSSNNNGNNNTATDPVDSVAKSIKRLFGQQYRKRKN